MANAVQFYRGNYDTLLSTKLDSDRLYFTSEGQLFAGKNQIGQNLGRNNTNQLLACYPTKHYSFEPTGNCFASSGSYFKQTLAEYGLTENSGAKTFLDLFYKEDGQYYKQRVNIKSITTASAISMSIIKVEADVAGGDEIFFNHAFDEDAFILVAGGIIGDPVPEEVQRELNPVITHGTNNTAGLGGYAIGINSKALGFSSFTSGNRTLTANDYCAAFNYKSEALGVASFAAGSKSKALGKYSTVFGDQSEAHGLTSFTSGYNNKVYSPYSTIFGSNNTSNTGSAASASFIAGSGNTLNNAQNGILLGRSNTAIGTCPMIFGRSNTITNAASTCATIIGDANVSGSNYSFVGGKNNYLAPANATCTVVFGHNNGTLYDTTTKTYKADGDGILSDYSLICGRYLKSKARDKRYIFGIFNSDVTTTGPALIIGNGTADNQRQNLFEVTTSAIKYKNKELAVKQEVSQEITNKISSVTSANNAQNMALQAMSDGFENISTAPVTKKLEVDLFLSSNVTVCYDYAPTTSNLEINDPYIATFSNTGGVIGCTDYQSPLWKNSTTENDVLFYNRTRAPYAKYEQTGLFNSSFMIHNYGEWYYNSSNSSYDGYDLYDADCMIDATIDDCYIIKENNQHIAEIVITASISGCDCYVNLFSMDVNGWECTTTWESGNKSCTTRCRKILLDKAVYSDDLYISLIEDLNIAAELYKTVIIREH
jgi:hypothetical protein